MGKSRFLRHLIALVVGQFVLGVILGQFSGMANENSALMGMKISNPTLDFVLLAGFIAPVLESTVLAFFMWSLAAMKAPDFLVKVFAGLIFGMMHASFGLVKVIVTMYAGVVYSAFFVGERRGLLRFASLCALHAANNCIVLLAIAVLLPIGL